MTIEEIIKAWREGKELEINGEKVTRLSLSLSAGKIVYFFNREPQDLDAIKIKPRLFGFDEARKRLAEGKVISRDGDDKVYLIVDRKLKHAHKSLGIPWRWNMSIDCISGYPLDWPDAIDFYEVE